MTYEGSDVYASGKPSSIIYGVKIAAKAKNNKKGTVTVSYNKVTGATKYQIYRSEKKNGKYTLVGTSKKTTFADKKAKKKKTYYVRIRTYKKVSGKTYYSGWSSVKKVKIKK